MDKCRIGFMHILMVQRTNYMPTLFGYGAPTNGIIINWRLPWDFHELCVRPYLWNQIFHYIVKQDKFNNGKTTLSNVVHIKPFTRQPIIVILTKKLNYARDGDVDLKGMPIINSPTKIKAVEVNTIIQQHFSMLNLDAMLNYWVSNARFFAWNRWKLLATCSLSMNSWQHRCKVQFIILHNVHNEVGECIPTFLERLSWVIYNLGMGWWARDVCTHGENIVRDIYKCQIVNYKFVVGYGPQSFTHLKIESNLVIHD